MAVPGPTGRETGQRSRRWGGADPKADASGDVLVAELYRRYHTPLLAFVLRLTAGDRQHAEDIVQETMLRAWRQAAQFDPADASRPSLMPWLATVARRIVIDEQRKRNARPMETDEAMLTKASVPDWTDDLLRSVIVADAMLELSPAHREILNETILRDRTVNEAAEVLGIPVGTVKSRVYYAIRALRLVLAEREVSL
jgi:RNA polymerase sigma-70 factor (ECF subfamily)